MHEIFKRSCGAMGVFLDGGICSGAQAHIIKAGEPATPRLSWWTTQGPNLGPTD